MSAVPVFLVKTRISISKLVYRIVPPTWSIGCIEYNFALTITMALTKSSNHGLFFLTTAVSREVVPGKQKSIIAYRQQCERISWVEMTADV